MLMLLPTTIGSDCFSSKVWRIITCLLALLRKYAMRVRGAVRMNLAPLTLMMSALLLTSGWGGCSII